MKKRRYSIRLVDESTEKDNKIEEKLFRLPAKEINRANGMLALGIIFSVISFVIILLMFIAWIFGDLSSWLIIFIISLFISIVFMLTGYRGKLEYERIEKNYRRYIRELNGNKVISINDLANSVDQDIEETYSDLRHMIKEDYFPEARIVENKSLFILDIPTYSLYKERKNEILSEASDIRQISNEQNLEEINLVRSKEIIDSANKDLVAINLVKNKIENKNFIGHIEDLENSSKNILKVIENHPESSHGLNKFSEYYLPTSVKLINAYYEFEQITSKNSKILKSMEQIDETIVDLTNAFERLQLDFLSDSTMEIKADIDTINLLLNQEGLKYNDWRSK
ncbi:5-bromo-4-chloroindolyl phosphate hydrolysis family protein [Anaerococcus provencensis]|uniref:5-bromo-4-chloroindolyl phosphate hydrolysis family protein n=1 Tax=Anaerococcus provencensis TaxID=938293 RepID=UPI0002EB392D|nr:5-bromo-4-chloroindolyl phosphate hydrolysis family protein [Anaerococcus provencensis]